MNKFYTCIYITILKATVLNISLPLLLLNATTLQAQSIRGIAVLVKGGYLYQPGAGKALDQIPPPPVNQGTFKNLFYWEGAEFYLRFSRMIVGMDAVMGQQSQVQVNDLFYEPRVTYGHLNLGYLIKDSKKFMFYPSIGFGVSRMSLIRNYKLNNEKTISLNSSSFDFAMNADYVFSERPDANKKYSGAMLSLKVGYRFSPADYHWRDDKNILNEFPNYSNQGVYVTIGFGYGYFVQKVKHIKYQKKFFD